MKINDEFELDGSGLLDFIVPSMSREKLPPLSDSPHGLLRWYAHEQIRPNLHCSLCRRPIPYGDIHMIGQPCWSIFRGISLALDPACHEKAANFLRAAGIGG